MSFVFYIHPSAGGDTLSPQVSLGKEKPPFYLCVNALSLKITSVYKADHARYRKLSTLTVRLQLISNRGLVTFAILYFLKLIAVWAQFFSVSFFFRVL